jgi:3-oxosteroid 1-dehydrogenase
MERSECGTGQSNARVVPRTSLADLSLTSCGGPLPAGRVVLPATEAEWHLVCDVVVVGTGIGALVAASTAHSGGASVLILERAAIYGGTSRSSGGTAWICNNPYMRSHGLDDPRDEALAYMARVGFAETYDPDSDSYGLRPEQYELLAAFYDEGANVVEHLRDMGAIDLTAPLLHWNDKDLAPDYYERFPENVAPRGRAIKPLMDGGLAGSGSEFVSELKAYLDRADVEVRLQHRVIAAFASASREVVGVRALTPTGETLDVRATEGVIFGSGGITHDPELRQTFLGGALAGGCGVPTNTGDFMRIAMGLGADIANASNAWLNEQLFETCGDIAGTNLDVFALPGDSMIMVNKYGRRIVNEKVNYNDRGRCHTVWLNGEFSNYLTFMVWDERNAREFAGWYPIPAPGVTAPHVITGDTLSELVAKIDERLERLWNERCGTFHTGRVRMAPDAATQLEATIAEFNDYARSGVDEMFHRGETVIEDLHAGPAAPSNDVPNRFMYPISDTGPYHATIIIGTAFETSCGPRTDVFGRVVSAGGAPIPGLYAVGNCAASIFGRGYPGSGATLGPAVVFGSRAGQHAAAGKGAASTVANIGSSDE